MLNVTEELYSFLKNLEDEKVLRLFHLYEEFEMNYLGLEANGLISFIPSSKINKLNSESPYAKFRSTIKFGRLLVSLFNTAKIEFTNSEIENLVNKFKSNLDEFNKFDLFDTVSGEDILKWYYYKNNLTYRSRPMDGKGSLGKSCSGHAINLELYRDNPERIKMVILYSDDTKTKIIGRSILWKVDENTHLMDRVYVENDSDYFLFKKYAVSKGYWRRSHNNKFEANFIDANENVIDKEIKIPINNIEYFGYPFLDTMKFYNTKEHYLTNKHPQGNVEGWLLLAMYGGRGGFINLHTGIQHNPRIDPYGNPPIEEDEGLDEELDEELDEI
jgi:hypothetical protein